MSHFGRQHICGVFYTHPTTYQRSYLPQVELNSHTVINPVCFSTQLTQTFQNLTTEALSQVRYSFPLYDGVAVAHYTISYGDKVLKGVVKQKDDAKKTYQAAVDRGDTAGLLESLPAGVFGVTLGNIPAKTDIVVEILYGGELKHDAAIDGLRYTLPTSIAPRYGEYPGQVVNSNTNAKTGISITVDVDMAKSAIRKIQSPSHPIAVSMGATSTINANDQAFAPSQASTTLTLGKAELAQDFILQLLIDDINKPQAILENHPTIPNHRAIMATLVPKFVLESMHPEIIFIADQSGSMSGSKNEALKSALKVFLKSLPLGVRFNICAFGHDFRFLWPKAQAYKEDSLDEALAFVDSFAANYGGTEVLKTIKASFEQRLGDLPLEVMLLTDGEIWAEGELFNYINEQIHDNKVDARVFALGIGGDVSHTLVEGVARAGNGFAQFVTQDEEIDQKVIRMLKGALYAHTTDYELEVNFDRNDGVDSGDEDFEIVEKVADCLSLDDKQFETVEAETPKPQTTKSFFDESMDVDEQVVKKPAGDRYAHLPAIETPAILQAPSRIPPLFPLNRTTIYLLLGPDSPQHNVASVTLRAKSAQGPLELNVPVHAPVSDNTIGAVHTLAARKAIQDLEEGRGWIQAAKTSDGTALTQKYASRVDELVERECVRLGEKFQVARKFTSFVAIEDRDGKEVSAQDYHVDDKAMNPYHRQRHPRRRLKGNTMFSYMARAADPHHSPPATISTPASHRASFPLKAQYSLHSPTTGTEQDTREFSRMMTPAARMRVPDDDYDNDDPDLSISNSVLPQGIPNELKRTQLREIGNVSSLSASNPQNINPRLGQAATQSRPPFSQAYADPSGSPQLASSASHFSAAPSGSTPPWRRQHDSVLHALIGLQTFSGAWTWNSELFSKLGISEANINRTDLGGDSNVCATALAVAYLERKLSSEKAVWEMLVAKARGWLGKNTDLDDAEIEAIVERAAAYF